MAELAVWESSIEEAVDADQDRNYTPELAERAGQMALNVETNPDQLDLGL